MPPTRASTSGSAPAISERKILQSTLNAPMDRTTLGRTGIAVSVAGLGCGGHSRLGLTNGGSEDEAIAVVDRALDVGINLVDTARAYRTEEVVGRALVGRRDEVVLSTKAMPDVNGELLSAKGLRESVEKSLGRLRTDRVDLFFVHGMGVQHLDHCREVLAPEFARLRAEGKVGFVAASEAFARDTAHETLIAGVGRGRRLVRRGDGRVQPAQPVGSRSVARRHAGARHRRARDVRRAPRRWSDPEVCRAVVADLVAEGAVDPATVADGDDPLGFLVHPDGAASVVDAAYRFARQPGCDVVLTGTGSVDHLDQNVRSITAGPLPDVDLGRLRTMFGSVDSISGN